MAEALPPAICNLESLLARGKDGALLRFGLGNEYLKLGRAELAISHLERAVVLDPKYSAAWKLLGQSRLQSGQIRAAREAWTNGIAVAEQRGDKQAAKEMSVFLRRLEKNAPR